MLLEHRDGPRMLPVMLQGRDELAEHRRGVRRQFQRAGQRPDRQVAGPALQARVAEVVQHPRILRAGAVPARRRRGGLRQVIEPGEPRGPRDQPCHLAQRQLPAVHAQLPQQTREVPGCQQALRFLKFPGHAPTLTKNPPAQR